MADNLTPEQRSRCMSRIKGKNTGLERLVGAELIKRGLRFKKQVKSLPGKPDVVFPEQKVVVFVDGDFWHGYRFPQWERSLTRFWRKKIRSNRKRDRRNFAKLRKMGWQVIRVWKHTIEKDIDGAVQRIIRALSP